MKRVVLDTNVLVSANLTSEGNPAKIVDLVSYSKLHLLYCPEILDEYKRVLAYEKLDIPVTAQSKAIEGIRKLGELVEPTVSTIPLADETDRIFYDTAKESGAILVTGNTKHFPNESFIMTPADFLASLENNPKNSI